jgi:hypothetical protein
MLIRKWSADFFLLRPHQNVGPSQGRCDQRRQRSVDDDVGEQPVDVDARWIRSLFLLLHIRTWVGGLVVRVETWWCGVSRPRLCVFSPWRLRTRVGPMRGSHARLAGSCFQRRASALRTARFSGVGVHAAVRCRQREAACAGSCYLQYSRTCRTKSSTSNYLGYPRIPSPYTSSRSKFAPQKLFPAHISGDTSGFFRALLCLCSLVSHAALD